MNTLRDAPRPVTIVRLPFPVGKRVQTAKREATLGQNADLHYGLEPRVPVSTRERQTTLLSTLRRRRLVQHPKTRRNLLVDSRTEGQHHGQQPAHPREQTHTSTTWTTHRHTNPSAPPPSR